MRGGGEKDKIRRNFTEISRLIQARLDEREREEKERHTRENAGEKLLGEIKEGKDKR